MSDFDASSIVPIPLDVLNGLRHAQPSQRKQLSLLRPAYQEGQPVKLKAFESAVKEGWRRNELIYSCINARALALSMVKLRVRDAEGAEQDSHPFRRLIQRPNPYMGESDFHMARVIYQLLSGHSYWEVVSSRAGQPAQLWPLRPDWVAPLVTSQGLIGWEYGPPSMQPLRLRPEQIVDFPLFDPLDLFGGTSPVVVAAYAGDTDNAVNKFAKDFFERGALPAGILKTTQKLLEPEIERIRAGWSARYGGAGNWLNAPAVLDADAEYQRITMSFEEMGFEALDSRNEARICMVMGVPPIIVGANVGLERSTYSNYETSEAAWWRNQLVPDCHHTSTRASILFAPYYGELDLYWDFDDIPALGEDQDKLWERARVALASGAILVDEYREMVGMEPLPGNKGQVLYVPSLAAVTPVAELGAPKPQPAALQPGTDQADAGDQGDIETVDSGGKTHAGPDATKADPPADAARRRTAERDLQGALQQFFDGELKRIERELRRGNSANR